MNAALGVAIAQEFCMPAYDQNHAAVVAFFKRGPEGRPEMQFCIPTEGEAEATQLALRFQELFVLALQRYEESVAGRLQIPFAQPGNGSR